GCRGLSAAPARVAATIVLRSGPITAVPFHMERIALPDFVRTPVTLPRRKGGAPDSGALITRVTLDGQPAGAGTLAVGLRALGKTEAKANPVATARNGWIWSEVPTDAAGVARLERVAP